MATSTSRRWFAPDHEFQASLDDYAVCNAPSTYIRHAKTHADTGCNRRRLRQCTFADMLLYLESNPCYAFVGEGQLVYADVDDGNPKHQEDVYGRIAKEVPLDADAESDVVKSTRNKLIEHLAEEWFGREKPARDLGDDDRYTSAKIEFDDMVLSGRIDDAVVGHILRTETEAAKKELLNIVSGQTGYQTQRPVLVLVDMIDDMQSTEMGVTKGWVIGYEFVRNLLIIKPFLSTKDQHPLGGSWYAPVENDDGIIYSGSPEAFAEKYVLAAQKHQDTKTADLPSLPSASLPAAFKPFVHTVAAKWILHYYTALSSSPSATKNFPNLETLKIAISTHQIMLSTVPFPVQDKKSPLSVFSDALSSLAISSSSTATEKETDASGTRVWKFDTFIMIQHMLESEEGNIRAIALNAKNLGDEHVANRAAEIWEAILDLVREVNEGVEDGSCWERYWKRGHIGGF